MIEGKIIGISGPIMKAAGLDGLGLYDMVEVGERGLLGEAIRLESGVATLQVYEDETGLRIGEPVRSRGRPLSALLGPGLLGAIYDGIQRPLKTLYEKGGCYLAPGVRSDPLDSAKAWRFTPSMVAGQELVPGALIGTVNETERIIHRILVAPGRTPSVAVWVAPAGDYPIGAVLVRDAGGGEHRMSHEWPLRTARPFRAKRTVAKPLITGLRVVDLLFPLAKGGCSAIPGGFGTGKTMTQHAIAKWCDADVIVYVGCGERGNEMTDVLTDFPKLIDPRTGRSMMERTVLIANTSNMPVAAREVSIYTGITIAEYYRDMGYDVAIMADSTSRWAEALRELSGRMEEMPAEEGFPAYLPTRLAEFYERGGLVESLSGAEGSVSIIGAVSPPGGDFSEPVTQHTKRFIRCFWALDRELANARHYPAISWTDSYSEYAQDLAPWWIALDPQYGEVRAQALELMKQEQRLAEIVRLIGPEALPDEQRLVLAVAELIKNGFLQQSSFDAVDMYCEPSKQVALLRLIMSFRDRALAAIKAGAPLVKITSLPIHERLARLKSEAKNDEPETLVDAGSQLAREFDELTRAYSPDGGRRAP